MLATISQKSIREADFLSAIAIQVEVDNYLPLPIVFQYLGIYRRAFLCKVSLNL
ncbi:MULTISPECIES: hypothetical protein [Aerosakkonema]|uniref:hypothetical protein n=1 Tax=Aerosakkonema TaxID=1246629 RepID=UPI0035B8434A